MLGRIAIVCLFGALLVGCAGPKFPVMGDERFDDVPHEFYAAMAHDFPVYRIDPIASELLVYVHRDGPLARLGHDHVIASHDVTGYVLWSDASDVARADLEIPLVTLTVDEAEFRAAAGFETMPSDDDVAGTRANMLVSLEASAFPVIQVFVSHRDDASDASMRVEITLHGVTRSFPVTVDLERGADWLRVSGTFDVLQSDFGIRPYSVFGGALSVRDRLEVQFRLEGRRMDGG